MDAIKIYRWGQKCHQKKLFRMSKFIYKINYILHNSSIPNTCIIGKNTQMAYGGIGIVLHKDVIIGENCILGQGCTIGGKFGDISVPKIGNNVYIGAGVRILGNIKIGDNTILAPNSVITKNIPANSVVAGIPGKIINKITKENIDKYIGYGIKL